MATVFEAENRKPRSEAQREILLIESWSFRSIRGILAAEKEMERSST